MVLKLGTRKTRQRIYLPIVSNNWGAIPGIQMFPINARSASAVIIFQSVSSLFPRASERILGWPSKFSLESDAAHVFQLATSIPRSSSRRRKSF